MRVSEEATSQGSSNNFCDMGNLRGGYNLGFHLAQESAQQKEERGEEDEGGGGQGGEEDDGAVGRQQGGAVVQHQPGHLPVHGGLVWAAIVTTDLGVGLVVVYPLPDRGAELQPGRVLHRQV